MQHKLPLVSVIIPNFNYAHFLSETVNSVLLQSYSNFECIIVDDGSTDNSKDVISFLTKKDLRVKSVFKLNGGLSSARNAGIKVSIGDYITFLDADDIWEENKLTHQIHEIINDKSVNFVFSNYIGFYPNNKTDYFKHEFGDTTLFDFIKQNPIAGSASSVLLSKELVNKVGYFDESLRSTEDHDYWFRCAIAGAKIKFCNQYDVRIRLHEISMSTNVKRMNYFNYYVFSKQLKIFPDLIKKSDLLRFRRLVNEKVQSLLWIARDTADFILIIKLYFIAVYGLGFNFSFRFFLKQNFLYDLKLFSKALKHKLLS